MVNFNFQKLADDIIASGASVVGLQEVDQITSRNQKHDTLKELSEYTGLKYYAYLPTISPFQGGEYGIAVLSKYPIVSTETKLLPKGASSDEQRGALKAVIDIGGINLDFVVTHCDGNTIAKQLAAIEEMVHRSTFYAVVGDFNCGVYKEFEVFEAATLANNSKNPLITTQNGKYIDNIVCSPGINIHVTTAVNTNHSDHFLVASTITITSE